MQGWLGRITVCWRSVISKSRQLCLLPQVPITAYHWGGFRRRQDSPVKRLQMYWYLSRSWQDRAR